MRDGGKGFRFRVGQARDYRSSRTGCNAQKNSWGIYYSNPKKESRKAKEPEFVQKARLNRSTRRGMRDTNAPHGQHPIHHHHYSPKGRCEYFW
jgi:hypothetical protein